MGIEKQRENALIHMVESNPLSQKTKNEQRSKELQMLIQFGFDEKASLIALEFANNDINAATAYLTDKDFMDNIKHQQSLQNMSPLQQLIDLGFDAKTASKTLKMFNNDLRKTTEHLIENALIVNENKAVIMKRLNDSNLID